MFAALEGSWWTPPAAADAPYFAEGDWQVTYPFQTPPDLHGIAVLGTDSAFVAGDDGAVWSTTDAGTTWTDLSAGSSVDFRTVAFADGTVGWIAGTGGTILHTTDGGLGWAPQASGTSARINDLAFIDAQSGWAVVGNGSILHTTNGGGTWTAQVSGTTSPLNSVCMSADGKGWAVGDGGTILHTTNGGDGWSAVASGSTENLRGVCSVYDSARVVGDNGTFLDNWWGAFAPRSVPSEVQGLDLLAVESNPDNFQSSVLVGESGTYCETFTGTFTQMWSTVRMFDVASAAGYTYWAVGRHGTVMRSSSLPDGWQQVNIPDTSPSLYDLSFANDATGWVVGAGGAIAKTTDGGASWTQQDSTVAFDLFGVAFRDASHGWTVGAGSTRLRTTDGGSTWTLYGSNGTGLPAFRDVAYAPRDVSPDEDRVWMAGDDDQLLRSSDGGETWTNVYPDGLTTCSYDDVCAPNAASLFAGGPSATLVTTGDFGTTFSGGSAFDSTSDLDFIDGSRGWAIGALQPFEIMRTSDGGVTSEDVTIASYGPPPRAVAAHSATLAWLIGDDGRIWRTQPETWGIWAFRETSGVSVDLHQAQAIDADHVWAVGDNGTVLHTVNGGNADFLPPVTTVSPPQDYHYRNTPVTLTFSATDDRSGVVITQYRTADMPADTWVEGTSVTILAPADHSADGERGVFFRSIDNAGNIEVEQSTWVRIDTVAPTVSADSDPPGELGFWRNTGIWIEFTVNDETGQTGGVEVSENGGGWSGMSQVAFFDAPADHSKDGARVITYRGYDDAGNVSAEQQTTFSIDTRKPVAKAPYVARARSRGSGSISFKITDARPCSGVCSVVIRVYTLGGRLVGVLQPQRWYTSSRLHSVSFKCPLKAGKYRFTVKGGDGAGNVTAKAARNYLIVAPRRSSVHHLAVRRPGLDDGLSPFLAPPSLDGAGTLLTGTIDVR